MGILNDFADRLEKNHEKKVPSVNDLLKGKRKQKRFRKRRKRYC